MSNPVNPSNESEKSKEMTKEDAYAIFGQIAAQFKGNLQDHITIQLALTTIAKAANIDTTIANKDDQEKPSPAQDVEVVG